MFEKFRPPPEETCFVAINMYFPHMDELNKMISTIHNYSGYRRTVNFKFLRIDDRSRFLTAEEDLATVDKHLLSLQITFQKEFTPYIREFCHRYGSHIQNANEIESNQKLLQWLEETKGQRVQLRL